MNVGIRARGFVAMAVGGLLLSGLAVGALSSSGGAQIGVLSDTIRYTGRLKLIGVPTNPSRYTVFFDTCSIASLNDATGPCSFYDTGALSEGERTGGGVTINGQTDGVINYTFRMIGCTETTGGAQEKGVGNGNELSPTGVRNNVFVEEFASIGKPDPNNPTILPITGTVRVFEEPNGIPIPIIPKTAVATATSPAGLPATSPLLLSHHGS